MGEQVDQVRFLPKPQHPARWRWYGAVIAAGPGWVVIGAIKILLGSFLAVLAFNYGLGAELPANPPICIWWHLAMSPIHHQRYWH